MITHGYTFGMDILHLLSQKYSIIHDVMFDNVINTFECDKFEQNATEWILKILVHRYVRLIGSLTNTVTIGVFSS